MVSNIIGLNRRILFLCLDLEMEHAGAYFNLPKEKGEYVIVLDLPTDKGNAQYVGNIVIQ